LVRRRSVVKGEAPSDSARATYNTSDSLSSLGTKQVLKQGEGVEDDRRQEAFGL